MVNQIYFNGKNWIVYDTINNEYYTYQSESFARLMKEKFDEIDRNEILNAQEKLTSELIDLDKSDFEIMY